MFSTSLSEDQTRVEADAGSPCWRTKLQNQPEKRVCAEVRQHAVLGRRLHGGGRTQARCGVLRVRGQDQARSLGGGVGGLPQRAPR